MAALSFVKNPKWAKLTQLPAPVYVDGAWKDQPGNKRNIGIWEFFDQQSIMKDFYSTMENIVPVKK